MTDHSGSDWIRAWIEQQREQLRRAGMAGTEPPAGDPNTDSTASAEALSGQIRTLGLRWLEAGQSYLQGWQQFSQRGMAGVTGGETPLKFNDEMLNAFQTAWSGATSASEGATRQFADLIARLPALGLAREHTEAWRELLTAQAECQQLEHEMRETWTRVQTEALAMVERVARERNQTKPGEPPLNSYRQLYDLWVECGETVFAQVAHSEAYAKLQAKVGNAAIRFRARQQAILEHGLKQFDLPTRSELNTVHRQLRELRDKVTSLEAQLAEVRGPEEQS